MWEDETNEGCTVEGFGRRRGEGVGKASGGDFGGKRERERVMRRDDVNQSDVWEQKFTSTVEHQTQRRGWRFRRRTSGWTVSTSLKKTNQSVKLNQLHCFFERFDTRLTRMCTQHISIVQMRSSPAPLKIPSTCISCIHHALKIGVLMHGSSQS